MCISIHLQVQEISKDAARIGEQTLKKITENWIEKQEEASHAFWGASVGLWKEALSIQLLLAHTHNLTIAWYYRCTGYHTLRVCVCVA